MVLMLQAAESAAGSSSSSCSCDRHGGAAVRLLQVQGRRMLAGHGEVLANGLMEHVNKGGGDVIGEEEKREVITGPNPLHNRR